MAQNRLQPEAELPAETMGSSAGRLQARAGELCESATDAGRAGYDATAATIGDWPISSLLLAVGLGIGIGWAWRGSAESDRRRDWIEALPTEARRRM